MALLNPAGHKLINAMGQPLIAISNLGKQYKASQRRRLRRARLRRDGSVVRWNLQSLNSGDCLV